MADASLSSPSSLIEPNKTKQGIDVISGKGIHELVERIERLDYKLSVEVADKNALTLSMLSNIIAEDPDIAAGKLSEFSEKDILRRNFGDSLDDYDVKCIRTGDPEFNDFTHAIFEILGEEKKRLEDGKEPAVPMTTIQELDNKINDIVVLEKLVKRRHVLNVEVLVLVPKED